jgi:hypothetical protein
VEGCELWAQKWCEYKPLMTTPQSRAYITRNQRAVHGRPLGVNPHPDPRRDQLIKEGMVADTSTQSINRKHGGSDHGDKTISPRYHDGRFFLQDHVELSLRLTGGYTHSLT